MSKSVSWPFISQLNLAIVSGIETSNLTSKLRFRHLISNQSQSFVSKLNSKVHFWVPVRIRKHSSFQMFNGDQIRNFISDFLLRFRLSFVSKFLFGVELGASLPNTQPGSNLKLHFVILILNFAFDFLFVLNLYEDSNSNLTKNVETKLLSLIQIRNGKRSAKLQLQYRIGNKTLIPNTKDVFG